MANTYAVTGATGNTGRVVAEKLLKAGHSVRAVGRRNATAAVVKHRVEREQAYRDSSLRVLLTLPAAPPARRCPSAPRG